MNSKEENDHTGADRAPDPKAVWKTSGGMNSKEENDHTGADRAPDPKAVCLDCFCAVMQGNHRKAVII